MDEESASLLPRGDVSPASPVVNSSSSMRSRIIFLVAATAAVTVGILAYVDATSRKSTGLSGHKMMLIKTGLMGYSQLHEDEVTELFHNFKSTYQKEYVDEDEETNKLTHFKNYLSRVDARNKKEKEAGGTAVHGLTKFADMSHEEFKEKMLGYRKPEGKMSVKNVATVEKYTGSLKKVDWRGIYTAGDVRDQGVCASCWAFSASQQIESDAIRAGLISVGTKLSTQQIVSCDTTDNNIMTQNLGCDGGYTEGAFDYIREVGGLVADGTYPYTAYHGSTGTCETSKTNYLVAVDDYYTIEDEDEMIDYVLSTGTLSACIDATEWDSYQDGVVSSCGTDVNHCVQIVGVHTTKKYWIIRNTWGSDWGDEGYIYLKTGKNTCALLDDPIYVTVSVPSTGSNKDNSKSIVIEQPTTTVSIPQPAVHKPLPVSPTAEAEAVSPSTVKTIVAPFTPSITTPSTPTTATKIDPLDKTHPGEGSGKAPPASVVATQMAEKQARVPASLGMTNEKQPPASVDTHNTKPATTTTTTTTATATATAGPPVWMLSNGDPTMVKHEALVGKLVQKNLNKASRFEAKANKLNEKAAATSIYPTAQVNKYAEKAASEELKAEQYRAGALLTAQESSLPDGVFAGVPMQPMEKGQSQGKGMGPPPPMQSSHTSNDISNTVTSTIAKGNVMLAGRPEPLSSPPSTPSKVTTVTKSTTIPIVPLSGGGSAPGLGASQAGKLPGLGLDASKQGLAPVMQSNKAPLPSILKDGNNENQQATLMETSLKDESTSSTWAGGTTIAQEIKPSSSSDTSTKTTTTTMQASGKTSSAMQSIGKAPAPLDKKIKVQDPSAASDKNSVTNDVTVSSTIIADISSLNLADPKHTPSIASINQGMQSIDTHTTKSTSNPPIIETNVVDQLVQKNLDKASQFEAKANKLNEKAAATSTYPTAQVNKYAEKAASEELKAEQYRAGALLTAQEFTRKQSKLSP